MSFEVDNQCLVALFASLDALGDEVGIIPRHTNKIIRNVPLRIGVVIAKGKVRNESTIRSRNDWS